MKKLNIILLIVAFLISTFSQAQRWKRSRYEAIYGIGATNAFTDLGGANKVGSHFIRDLEMRATRPSVFVGARYKIKELIAIKFNIINGWVKGSDAWTTEPGRANRGITFYSPIIEMSTQIEYSIAKEHFGTRYTFSNMRRFHFQNVNTYIFTGIGGMFFSPKVKYNGVGSYQKPTDQYKTSKQKKYSKVAAVIPVGIGFKYGINRRLALGVEFSERWTSTDYLDNHSDIHSEGNDTYLFMHVYLAYKLRTARSGLPRF